MKRASYYPHPITGNKIARRVRPFFALRDGFEPFEQLWRMCFSSLLQDRNQSKTWWTPTVPKSGRISCRLCHNYTTGIHDAYVGKWWDDTEHLEAHARGKFNVDDPAQLLDWWYAITWFVAEHRPGIPKSAWRKLPLQERCDIRDFAVRVHLRKPEERTIGDVALVGRWAAAAVAPAILLK